MTAAFGLFFIFMAFCLLHHHSWRS